MTIYQDEPPATNYLSRIARAGVNQRKWVRRDCNIITGLMYTRNGLRDLQLGQATVLNISEGGAFVRIVSSIVPPHFYLYLGEFQYLIGCSVASSNEAGLGVKFIRELDTGFVDVVGRITDPFEFIGKIRPSLYGLPVLEVFPHIAPSRK